MSKILIQGLGPAAKFTTRKAVHLEAWACCIRNDDHEYSIVAPTPTALLATLKDLGIEGSDPSRFQHIEITEFPLQRVTPPTQ